MVDNKLYLEIKTLLLKHRMSETQIAKLIGMEQANFNRKLNAGTLRYSEVEKLLNSLGYEIKWEKINNNAL